VDCATDLGVVTIRPIQNERRWFERLPRLGFEFFSVLSFLLLWASSYNEFDDGASIAPRVGLSAASAAAFYVAKRSPIHSFFLLAALCVVVGIFSPGLVSVELLLIVAMFLVSWRTSFSLSATLTIGVIGISAMYTAKLAGLGRTPDFSIVLQALVESGLAVGFGAQTRRLRLANEQLVRLAAVDRRNAVVDERRRIASELHDVAAHLLSAIAVKSKLALRLDTREDLRAANAFAGKTASEALTSMRTLVGVLSTDGDEVPLAPQPRLDELVDIQRRMTTAGLHVDMQIPNSLTDLPRQVELAVVRIVQESLTNTLRHRGPGQAWVRVVQGAKTLTVEIDDDGSAPLPGNEYGSGHGLLSMRERASACGGSLRIGPSPQGGWRVAADLPCVVP
jgi:signal transduction histidine kinase